jgi:hypothetical protein
MALEVEQSSLADGNGGRRRLHSARLAVAGHCDARLNMDELQQVKVSAGLVKDKIERGRKGVADAALSSGELRRDMHGEKRPIQPTALTIATERVRMGWGSPRRRWSRHE